MQDVGDHGFTKAEFENLLKRAEAAAESDWDCNFIADIRENWDKYRFSTRLSLSQLNQINRIAKE